MFECYVLASKIERVAGRFGLSRLPESQSYIPSYNISLGSMAYIITNIQTKEIRSLRFGIAGLGRNFPDETCFVRAEGNRNIRDDPTYTGSKAIFLQPELQTIIRTQRCLVLADAIIVGKQNPHLVYLRNKKRPFAMAGVWSKDKEGRDAFAVITCPSNDLLYSMGIKRMPVILPVEYENRWIHEATELAIVLGMLNQYPTGLMNAYPIFRCDNSQNNISLVQPVGRPLLQESKPVQLPQRKKKKVKDYTNVPTLGERVGYKGK